MSHHYSLHRAILTLVTLKIRSRSTNLIIYEGISNDESVTEWLKSGYWFRVDMLFHIFRVNF